MKNVKNKFKLSLLQIEKRFVDLETTVGKLLQKVKNIDSKSLGELKEKVNELENLIMVEQTGIIELKKILEGYTPGRAKLLLNIKKKLSEIEERLANLDAAALESRIKNIADTFNANLDLKWKEIQKSINLAEERLKKLHEKVLEEIKNVKINSIEKLSEELSELRDAVRHLDEFKLIKNKVIETMANLNKEVEKSKAEYKLMIDGIRSAKSEMNAKVYTERENSAERFEEIGRRIEDIKAYFDVLNTRINEIMGKIINLETKISVIEKMRIEELEKARSEIQPIIIE